MLNNIKYAILIFTIIPLLASCIENATYSTKEMQFVQPFRNLDSVIYKSKKGVDTIIFHTFKIDTAKYRNIEQGFYNELSLYVSYEITKRSYHRITVQSINNELEHFILFIKAKNSHSSKEIDFLGLIFDDDYINKILNTNDSIIVFRQENATYNGMNINEGIKSFEFSFSRGILSYVDEDGVKWNRIN